MVKETEQLPARSQLAAAFITYLGNQPEDVRRTTRSRWLEVVGLDDFDVRRFLSSEREMLLWKGEGLPSDDLSVENALIILKVGSSFTALLWFGVKQLSAFL